MLVCGGRNFNDSILLLSALSKAHAHRPIGLLIHGGAKGADIMAGAWAKGRGIHVARVDALWDAHGKAAGPARNRAMLLLKPDVVIAFPGGSGTAHMVGIAREAGITVWQPRRKVEAAREQGT